jgi:hypothetical protein
MFVFFNDLFWKLLKVKLKCKVQVKGWTSANINMSRSIFQHQ